MSDDDGDGWQGDEGPGDWQEWADDWGEGYVIDDDGDVIDTETGEIVANVFDDDYDEGDGGFWDDVADLNDVYLG